LATLSAASFGLTLYFRAEASSEKSAAAACTAGLLTGVRPCPRGIYDQHQRNARVADATADSTTVVACITGAATLATGVAALWWPADQVGQRAGTAPLSVRVLPSLVVLRGRY